jgi:hypothetical protein
MDTNESQDAPVNRTGFYMWECTHERCILQFRRRSDRDNHLDTGRHKFESNKISVVEKAKSMYKNQLDSDTIKKNIALNNFTIVQNIDPTTTTKALRQGWGLPTRMIQKRFNVAQKKYMIDAYDHGEETGFKINPATLSIVSKTLV